MTEHSPWIEHDGKGFPRKVWANYPLKDGWKTLQVAQRGPGRYFTPLEQARGYHDPSNPGWTWRRKFGLFGPWVASDPAYARIVRYRFARDSDGSERERESQEPTSQAVGLLRDIVANPQRELEVSE